MRINFNVVVAAAALTFCSFIAGQAGAQPTSDPSIDQRVDRMTTLLDPEAERAEAILTGRDDIVLLERRKLFSATGAIASNYTNNAALAPSDPESDHFTSLDAVFRFQTRIANRVDVHAQAGASMARYSQLGQLDYDALAGSIGAHTQWKSFDFDVAYTPVVVFDRDFGERQLTQHRVVASVGRSIDLPGSGALRVSIAAERIEADPEPFTNSAVSVNVIAGAPLSRRRRLDGFISARAVARNYDNYFEGLVGAEREDRLIEGAVGLAWAPRTNVSIDLQWAQSRNRSTSDVNRYRAGSGGVSVGARIRF